MSQNRDKTPDRAEEVVFDDPSEGTWNQTERAEAEVDERGYRGTTRDDTAVDEVGYRGTTRGVVHTDNPPVAGRD